MLALAEDPSQPLLERAKFLAIFASNLDEFYMVRVAGLKRRDEAGLQVRSADDLTREQLARISARTMSLAVAHAKVFLDEVSRAGQGRHPDQPVVLVSDDGTGRSCRPTSPRPCSRC